MIRHRKVAALAAGTALLFVAGCGQAAEKIAEEATEKALESESGNDTEVDFNTDDGEVSITDDEGNSFQAGSAELPEDWPSELAPPDSVSIVSASTITNAGEATMTVVGETDASVEEMSAGILNQLGEAGYDIVNESSTQGSAGASASILAEDGTNSVIATISENPSGESATSVSMIVGPQS